MGSCVFNAFCGIEEVMSFLTITIIISIGLAGLTSFLVWINWKILQISQDILKVSKDLLKETVIIRVETVRIRHISLEINEETIRLRQNTELPDK